MKRENHSIRNKLTIWYTSILSAILIAFSFAVSMVLWHTMVARFDSELKTQMSALRHVLKERPHSKAQIEDDLGDLEEFNAASLLLVVENDQVLLQTREWDKAGLSNDVTPAHNSTVRFFENPRGKHFRIREEIVHYGNVASRIVCALDVTDMVHSFKRLFIIMIVGIPFLLALTALSGLFLTDKILKPIRSITMHAKKITQNNLSEKIVVKDPHDEFGQLAVVFNDLLSRLHDSFEQLRRFTADASHELRTPLTAIRSVGETALQKELSPQEYRDVLGSMLEEVNRQTALIENLLTLTRGDSNQIEIHPESVEVGSVVWDTIDLLHVLAEEKCQNIVIDIPDSYHVNADPAILRQAIINIIDNAIKFTKNTGSIVISVKPRNNSIVIEVTDPGPGIMKEDLLKIFDRFYRVDKARTASITGGTGLGLAIAKWAVEINGGTVDVESDFGHGSTFRIVLPAAS